MARIDGGAIVLDAWIDGADFTRDAKRLSGAARELDIAVRRAGEALRASAGRFGRAAEESVRATRLLRTQALVALGDSAAAWKAAAEKLDGLDYAMRGLRESTRLAFGPMLTLAAPALTGLTQLLSGAILKAGMFAAALSGQDVGVTAAPTPEPSPQAELPDLPGAVAGTLFSGPASAVGLPEGLAGVSLVSEPGATDTRTLQFGPDGTFTCREVSMTATGNGVISEYYGQIDRVTRQSDSGWALHISMTGIASQLRS